jgi:hypothetical protein
MAAFIFMMSRCTISWASYELLPSLEDVHIAQGLLPHTPGRDADKLQQAFVLQTGLDKDYKMFRANANHNFDILGHKSEDFIEQGTWISKKQLFLFGGTAYVIAKKEYSTKIPNPFFPTAQTTVTVGTDHASLGIKIPF